MRWQATQELGVSPCWFPFCHLLLLSILSLFLPSYLFPLLWCDLLCGPQSPGRWHEVPLSRRVSPALRQIMSPSTCSLSCLLLSVPPTSSRVSCPQWLLSFLNYAWVVAVLVCGGLFPSIAKLSGTTGVAPAASPLPPPADYVWHKLRAWLQVFLVWELHFWLSWKKMLPVMNSGDRISSLCVSFSSR